MNDATTVDKGENGRSPDLFESEASFGELAAAAHGVGQSIFVGLV